MQMSVRLAVSAMVAVLSLSSARAQTSFGQVTGSVTDEHGAAVPAASVRARNVETNVASETVTSSDGLYNVLSLIPGTYELVVEKTGFDKAVMTRVAVLTGQTASVDVRLKVGKVTTTVEVSAQAVMLNSSSSDVATTVGQDLLQDLPYTERNVLEAAMLVPGVRGDPNSPGQVFSENAGIYTANVAPGAATNMGGGMPGSASIMVDGSNVTQASIGRTAMTVSGSMAAEVTVITNGVPAKYGNTGGGVIIQGTRSGTNQYHGEVSWRHNDPAFNNERVGTVPFGYRVAADGLHLEADSAEQRILSRIRELKAERFATRQIADELNRQGFTTRRGTAWRFQYVAEALKAA